MTTQAQISMRFEQARRIRQSKKQRIYAMFEANLGHRFKSNELHEPFGTAFRTRCSEINLDPKSKIVIRNRVSVEGKREASVYWAEVRTI